MDSAKINILISKILNNEYQNIHCVLILKDNKLVCEEYFNGYDAEMHHSLYSAGKSLVSTLIGIAIDKGFIKNSDQTLRDLFPGHHSINNNHSENSEIKLKHILTMTTGLDCGNPDDFENNCSGRLLKEEDPINYIMQLPMAYKPGEHFYYNDGTPKILQYIVHKTSKMRYDLFKYKYLYAPLSIAAYRPSPGMTPREMAKIGMLYLNKGQWRGEQVLSEEWIENTSKKHIKTKYGHYGYLWWIGSLAYKDTELETFYAAGNGGQFIFVIPKVNMVAVFTGGNYNNMEKTIQPIEMLEKYILPAIQ
jgi:CubicO group peptidase (beta-lactamase class C family)